MGLDHQDFENAWNQQDGQQMYLENEVYQNNTRMQKIATKTNQEEASGNPSTIMRSIKSLGCCSQHGMVFVQRFCSQV